MALLRTSSLKVAVVVTSARAQPRARGILVSDSKAEEESFLDRIVPKLFGIASVHTTGGLCYTEFAAMLPARPVVWFPRGSPLVLHASADFRASSLQSIVRILKKPAAHTAMASKSRKARPAASARPSKTQVPRSVQNLADAFPFELRQRLSVWYLAALEFWIPA